jgi:hypothetical protein
MPRVAAVVVVALAGEALDLKGVQPSQMHAALLGAVSWLEGREVGEQLPISVANVLRVRIQLRLAWMCCVCRHRISTLT